MGRMNPKAAEQPHLPAAGYYGGGQNGCECELLVFEHPAIENMPQWEGAEDQEHAFFLFRVSGDIPAGSVLVRALEETGDEPVGSRAQQFLEALGVPFDEEGNYPDDTPETLQGTKCIIRVLAPRMGKDGVTRTGRVVEVISAS